MVQITELLGNKRLLKLTLYLADNSSQEFSYTQIRKRTKLAKATLTKWLGYLHKEELVYLKTTGRNKLYQINRENGIIKQLKILFSLTTLQFFINLSKKHSFEAYLFGSASRGEDTENSDFDILVIGNVKKEAIIAQVDKQSKKLKRAIRLQIFTPLEWLNLKESDKAFYERVEKDKILIR